ncbi:late competence protein ComER [Evansella cellulosilytica]|uniref:Pyrroline-5-carboxylate reductase n=1 Tax=Evansella cellulosilytica (strain ATCC 21833 / DSM 2522 / FERM P-1141 / JCM 9156 / N-4) TaxID=649639 RepID=E6TW14_EVAC2|nr:late competence protein ComER [Evansella cellulosilytica]ADU29837.1 Pyrroline-5-carboxylate reductase [Evansella cellulosilytica DSM 2522]
MKRIGFIGTGSMGKILIESFLDAHAITPNNVTITNRTIDKAKQIADSYEGVNVAGDARSLIKECDWVFLCTKPLQMIPLLEEVKDILTERHVLISITSPLLVEELEKITEAKVVRFIPSIVNRAQEGPSLVTFGQNVANEDKEELMRFFKTISTPELISDDVTRVASDIGCCGPAFISFLVEEMIKAAVQETNIKEDEATNIMESMLIGYGELLRKKYFTLQTLQERVTVPGGVTGVGLNVLRSEIGQQFNHLFKSTHEKYAEDRHLIQKQLTENNTRAETGK